MRLMIGDLVRDKYLKQTGKLEDFKEGHAIVRFFATKDRTYVYAPGAIYTFLQKTTSPLADIAEALGWK